MARCLRCKAGNEWIEGDARESADLTHALEFAESEARALRDAITGLLKYHQEGDDGAELPREYWSPGYREAVEHAEALVGSNVEHQGPRSGPLHGPVGPHTQED